MKNMQVLGIITMVFLIIGGLNWGLIGLVQWNFIASVFGYTSVLTRVIYVLAGVSAVFKILCWAKHSK